MSNTPTYTIGSEKGYNIVNQLQAGQSTNSLSQEYRPSDGSVWTKQNDGSISVMHNGQQMVGQVTYQPTQSQAGAGGTSGSGSSGQTPSGVYTIGSEKGYNLANSLQVGQSATATDGSVWTKNADGTISVLHNGQLMTGNITYQPVTQTQPIVPTTPTTEYVPITTTPITPGQSALIKPSEQENRLTADDIKAMYDKMAAQQQEKIDYTVQQAVDELNRAQEDAQKGYADQRNKVNIEEAQARDAQVLYAAARGDRGGITGRQYDSISNTAANNRAAINQAQQQLATDTARQIADLRAQGEFEKADALLQIAQQQLAQLWELQKYNDNLILQEQSQAMQESSITGSYNGTPTIDVQLADREFNYNVQAAEREWQQALKEWDYNTAQQEREWAYEIAMQSIQAGIVPDASTLAAAGIDSSTASQMASIYKASLTAKSSGGGGGGGGGVGGADGSPSISDQVYKNAAAMYANGATDEDVYAYLLANSPDETWAQTYASFLGLVANGEPDISTYTITNETPDDTSIVVPGFGRMLFEGYNSVAAMMEKGYVEQVVDHDKKTITYRRVV